MKQQRFLAASTYFWLGQPDPRCAIAVASCSLWRPGWLWDARCVRAGGCYSSRTQGSSQGGAEGGGSGAWPTLKFT